VVGYETEDAIHDVTFVRANTKNVKSSINVIINLDTSSCKSTKTCHLKSVEKSRNHLSEIVIFNAFFIDVCYNEKIDIFHRRD